MDTNEFGFETQAIRTQTERSQFQEHSTPLCLTSSFVFSDAENMRAVFAEEVDQYSYSRYDNPNIRELVDKICLMEKAENGYAFATGMAAIYCTMSALLENGDHVLACSSIFGSTLGILKDIFPKRGITCTFFAHQANEETIEAAVQKHTRMIFLESPTNPGTDILDLEAVQKVARRHNLLIVVDNTFATPYLQTPIDWGADLMVHSTTKLMDGQGRVSGGVVVGKREHVRRIQVFARTIGSSLSPFDAWVLSKSLETLPVRLDRHCQNALEIARFLENHTAVQFVKYPFLASHPQHDRAKKYMKQGGNIVAFAACPNKIDWLQVLRITWLGYRSVWSVWRT